MLPLFTLFLVLNALKLSVTLPQGAPESVCDSLLPFHGGGLSRQTTPSPFRIVPAATVVEQGQILRVEIRAEPRELVFGGYMIHARTADESPYRVVGRFAPSADGSVKLISCLGGEENTATHTSPQPKLDFFLDWQAPADFIGEVVFNATVAQTYDIFWVGVTSPRVRVVPRGQVAQHTTQTTAGISTTRRPFHTPTSPTWRPSTLSPEEARHDVFFDGCGQVKSCFGFPAGCIETETCKAAVATNVRGERYFFEMKSFEPGAKYVASALSIDDKMGNDSVIECVPDEDGKVQAFASWTTRNPFGVTRQDVPQNIFKLLEGTHEGGKIYCRVERDAVSTVNGARFDLINRKYNVLVASGSSVEEDKVGYHDIGRDATAQATALTEVANLASSTKLLLRLHGAFMLIAWIGTASLGILLARYFKETWVNSSHCGKDIWFAWHRFLMFLTWLLTIAAFIIIFIEIGGWSSVRNPHAILGTVTTIICFIQPIGAFFRPHPGAKRRPLFNWAHWLGGNVAHILAVITIFFAVQLSKAELPAWLDYLLVAYVGFHVLMHFIFSILSWIQMCDCVTNRRHTQRINTFPMHTMTPSRMTVKSVERKQDAPFSKLRKGLLGLYIAVLFLIVIALVVIAVFAPIEENFNRTFKKMLE